MRTTMRKDPSPPSSSEDEYEFTGKGNRIMGMKVRKHPNKHHEGQRKRWRDQITERERKRYEGVWAANKGMYLPAARESGRDDEDPSLDVLNIVVREIWIRSRLPDHVLEEVWALTHVTNHPSRAVAAAIGMRDLGVHTWWYEEPSQVFRADRVTHPRP